MSLLSREIAEKFQKEYCSDTTSSQNFWIWDPTKDSLEALPANEPSPKPHCHLLLTPNMDERKESLEVITKFDSEKTLVAVDKCLILDKVSVRRCDAMLILQNDRELIWIELKLNLKTKNANPSTLRVTLFGDKDVEGFGGAFEQIIETKRYFEDKGVNIKEKKNKDFVGIPKKLMSSKVVSQELQKQRAKFKLRYKFEINVGDILDLE